MVYKTEHLGLRIIRYYDSCTVYPYTPGARRGNGYIDPEGNWIAIQRARNRQKIERARNRRAEKMISDTVKVMARNGGVFFTVTSAGIPGKLSGKINALIKHMRERYGLLYYTWVREKTKSGLTHWHFAAVFTLRGLSAVNYLKQSEQPGGPARVVKLSNWWSRRLGGKEYGNSIRLGWDYRGGRAQKYTLTYEAAGYLVKYLRKGQEGQEKGARKWQTNLDYLRPCRFDVVREYAWDGRRLIKTHKFDPVQSDAGYFLSRFFESPAFDPGDIDRKTCRVVGNATYWARLYFIKARKIDLRALTRYLQLSDN